MGETGTGAPSQLVTEVLRRVAAHESQAAEELLPLVYEELRRLARERMSRLGPGQTLEATALVHEAWLRVTREGDPGWECRAHFFGAAARAMRDILVERARRKGRLRHGGAHARAAAEEGDLVAAAEGPAPEDLLALDAALEHLQRDSPFKAQVVELRFFTGLAMPEIAELLGVSLTRVEREWRFARAWLQREVEGRDR